MARKIKRNPENRVVGYLRVSTDEQSLGAEDQRIKLKKWCNARKGSLLEVFEDIGISGGNAIDKRPGLILAVKALKEQKAGILLVSKRDRLARDVIVAAMIERLAHKAGAQVVAADGTANGDSPESQLMRRMIDAFAEYERALIRSRIKAALNVKQSKGERTGQVPYGYILAGDGISLEEDPMEQKVIVRVQKLRDKGLSIRAIAEKLNMEKKPARGSRWHPTSVSRILSRMEETQR